MMKTFCSVTLLLSLLLSCRTVHFDGIRQDEAALPEAGNLEAERRANEREEARYAVEEELKEVDIEAAVIYIDRPVYSPERPEIPRPQGGEAVREAKSSALQIPMDYHNGIMYYPWDESFEYEIHTQTYRTTDIMLEPGEQILELPFLSESQVWEVGAGASRENGQDAQHIFVKPSLINLTTSMIIITDRRVYHLLLKSFRDQYMVMVRWRYPPQMPFKLMNGGGGTGDINRSARDIAAVDPAMLSFDYKMTYSIFKKPLWLPRRVYDDGAKTYIQLDERMLHDESPVLFNNRDERINYRVSRNLIILDELIEKVTLRKDKEKVTITKKSYRPPEAGEE
jgi:type IV secretion system protein VirB9